MMNDLFRKLSIEDQKVPLNIKVPNDFYQTVLEQLMERDYLSNTSKMKFFDLYQKRQGVQSKPKITVNWVQITRLPVHPNENEKYDLLSRWQGVLSSLHSWGYRLYFLLLRHEGTTKLFLGTATTEQGVSAADAVNQLGEAASASMPGVGLKMFTDGLEVFDNISEPLQKMNYIGAVTGIPSFQQTENKNILQTLDQLAFGIRDTKGNEKNFALLIIADPISDEDISDIISLHRRLSTQIHTAVKMTGSESSSKSESYDPMAKKKAGAGLLGTVIGGIGASILGAPPMIGTMIGGNIANLITSDMSRPQTVGGSSSVSYEYLDKFAEYAEAATEHHIKRLNDGRNFGFWNTGVYVMGDMPLDVRTVTGMLRSIYSGEETYYEPIRLHMLEDPTALKIVRERHDLIPLLDADVVKPQDGFKYSNEQWHVFGKYYQYLSTPISTKELSLATSLPRRDVPGLRFVKTAVRFANNPAVIDGDRITIGNLVDTGVIQNTTYDINPNSLVRHALIAGSTGSGKSTTCKRILSEVLRTDTPIMIIEPAKDDYVRWAIEMNKSLPNSKKFKIFMPGVKEFNGTRIEELKINGYAPAYAKGAKVDLLQHSETFATLLNACLPSEDVIPILIEEVVYEQLRLICKEEDIDFESTENNPLVKYPDIDDMIAMANIVMKNKNYDPRVQTNMREVLFTRFKSLKRGMRGKILNNREPVDYDSLFNHNVIINISRLSGTKDKALIMSLIMNSLYEYRISKYNYDKTYREKAQKNRLMHLCLVEEAHNVLLKPQGQVSSGSPQNAVADLFGNMLSEVRGYGQGFMIVDQVPTRLIDDVIKNTNYKIVHRLTAPDDQEVMARCMAFREDQKYIIPALERGYAIICGDEDDAAVWVKIPSPYNQNRN